MNQKELEALKHVEQRLSERFPAVPEQRVRGAVMDSANHLDDARIRQFIPVLVEKDARDRLERLS
jgi:hypothetical protein